jgi:uracil-DNA glycosylase
MDPHRRRLYLDAMGIRTWRLRGAPGAGWDGVGGSAGADDEVISPAPGLAPALADPAPTPALGLAVPAAPLALPAQEPLAGSDSAGLDWDDLRVAVAACHACGLCATRTQTVFGVGRRDAKLMLIGEAPGAEEDRQGEPFVGRAGQLLNRMLAAIGLERGQVYIANILKCRPPGNRDPRPEEAAACRAFLTRQIQLIEPRLILSLGRVSAQNLLATDEPVGKLRGRWFSLGPDGLPLMVTYHPSYLLRSPEQKARVWQDLTQVARRLRG